MALEHESVNPFIKWVGQTCPWKSFTEILAKGCHNAFHLIFSRCKGNAV